MKQSDKLFLLLFILPILAYHFSLLAFVSFVPIFYFVENKKPLAMILAYFLPFYVYIYSGIYKSTHEYYGLFFLISSLLVLALALYQIGYIVLATYAFRKSNLPITAFPLYFVVGEFLKNKLFYGMPLGNLNILTYNLSFFIKDASIFGSLFIDLKILFVNLAIYQLICKKKYKLSLAILILCFISIIIPNPKPIKTIKSSISIVQGNIPQNEKWALGLLERNLNIYLSLSDKLKSDYVFWPESAYPYIFIPKDSKSIKELIDNNNFSLIFGALTREKPDCYFNSAVFYSKNKLMVYNKQNLVPFAEFIPFAKILGFENESLTKGKSNVLFKGKLNIGPMICYEENFESISRKYKDMKANLLAVLTNDAWFDKTPTFYLFQRSDIYRAIENHIWILRAANTGTSFIVNPFGKIKYSLKPDTRNILTKTINITVFKKTLYDKFGFLTGWFILFISMFLFFCKRCKNQIKA